MDNRPGVISDSLIEFGQGGDYHTHSMTEAKESAGFAPLETLPAEWYNNYLYKLDAHINQLQVIARQIQQELSNLLTTAPTPIEPSATDLTQVKAAINQMIEAHTPDIATGSKAGIVVSSAQMNSVSVDADGVMTPNALSDWTETDTVKEYVDAHKPEIATTTDTGVVLSSASTDMKGVSVNSTTGAMTVNALSDWTATTTINASMFTYETHSATVQAGATVLLELDRGLIQGEYVEAYIDYAGKNLISRPAVYRSDTNGYSTVITGAIQGITQNLTAVYSDDMMTGFGIIIINTPVDLQVKLTMRISNGLANTYIGPKYLSDIEAGDVIFSPFTAIQATSAISATYLRPADSSSTLVTADASGNLKAHTLTLT